MRKLYAGLIFGIAVVVVLGIIVLTWRPWRPEANDRITASGLVPVLTLLLGQLGSWVIASGSTAQAVEIRKAELEHDAEQSAKASKEIESQRVRDEQIDAQKKRVATMLALAGAIAEALPDIALAQRASFDVRQRLVQLRLVLLKARAGEDGEIASRATVALLSLNQYNEGATDTERQAALSNLMTDLVAVEEAVVASKLLG